jgi:FkbM family methyltransferase
MNMSICLLRLKKLFIVLSIPELRTAFLRHGVLAGVEHKVALKKSLKTVVDIGANKGQFALAALAFTDANVFSFEPLNVALIKFHKVFTGRSNVKVFNFAIGSKQEQKIIHLSGSDDSSSLLEISEKQEELFPGTAEVGTLIVEVAPLDRFIGLEQLDRPAMLKLDVQGSELDALKGSSSLFINFDYIYCECSFLELYVGQALASQVIQYLADYQFRLTGFYNASYDELGNCIQADLLFKK